MKKLLKWVLPCLCLTALLSACSDDDNNKLGVDLTPDENKAKLESIAKDLVGKIDPQAHKSLILLADDFSDISGSLEIEEAVDIMKTVKQICEKSDVGGMMAFTRAGSKIYSASRYYGIYTYDKGRWNRADSNEFLELRFQSSGKNAVIRLTASTKGTNVDIENGDQVTIPETASFTVTLGGSELCKLAVNTALNKSAHTVKLQANLSANGYAFDAIADMSKNKGTCVCTMKKDNEELIKESAEVNGQNLTDPSDNNLDNPQTMFGHVLGNVSVLNQVHFSMACSDVNAFVDRLDDIDYSQDFINGKFDDEKSMKEEAAIYNEYLKTEMRYTDSEAVVATFGFQAYLEYTSSYDNSKYWELEPVIIFTNDGSPYSFDSYFDEVSFKSLIDQLERLEREYESILG